MRPLIFVCQVFYPDTQSTSQLFTDLLEQLAARGHAITVLSGYPGQELAQRPPRRETWRGIRILRGGAGRGFKRSWSRRVLAYATYLNFVFWRILLAPGGGRVLVVTNPPIAPLAVWIACALRRRPWTGMLLDVYPDGLVALGHLRRGSGLERVWSWANGRALRAATEVWVLGRDMQRLVAERYRVAPARIRYVPHWSSVVVQQRREAEETRLWRQLGLEGRFVVQYSGNMGLWHDMDTIVRAAALLREDPRIHFLFIGSGIRRQQAELLSRKLALPNVSWLPFRERDELRDSLACCNVALISQLESVRGVAVPCKLYGILASGRSVVAQVPEDSEVALVLVEERCGVVVPPGNALRLAEILGQLARRPEEVTRMGQRAFEAYRAKYTLETAVARFDQLWSGDSGEGPENRIERMRSVSQ